MPRPKLPDTHKRIRLVVTIAPETARKIEERKRKLTTNAGRALDSLLA
jgi:hypothetical protein